MTDETTGDDRPNAMLTSGDRQFLLGKKEYKHRQTAADRRKAIRERAVASLSDFTLLFGHLDDRERAKIADEIGMNEWTDAPDHSLMAGPPREVVHAIAFLHRLHADADPRESIEMFERTVEEAFSMSLQKERGGFWDVDVDIDPDRVQSPDADAIREKLRDGRASELNGPEAQWLTRRLDERGALDDVLATIDAPTPQEEIQRGISEGKLTFDRLNRLKDEGVVGIEVFPDPRDVEARQSRSPYDE